MRLRPGRGPLGTMGLGTRFDGLNFRSCMLEKYLGEPGERLVLGMDHTDRDADPGLEWTDDQFGKMR